MALPGPGDRGETRTPARTTHFGVPFTRTSDGGLIWGAPRKPLPPTPLRNRNDTRPGDGAMGLRRPPIATHDGKWHENKKPHPSTMSRRKLHRGNISMYNDWTWLEQSTVKYNRSKGGVRFNFLFNPTRYGIAWSVNQELVDRALQDPLGGGTPDTTAMGPAGNASVDLQLLLDRQPEVNEGSLPEGVLHDLSILQLLTTDDGILRPQPVEVRTGAGIENHFRFIGMITSMNVDLTNFNEKMVPMRAAVSLNLVRYHDLMQQGVLPIEAYGESPGNSRLTGPIDKQPGSRRSDDGKRRPRVPVKKPVVPRNVI
jgi:hypothetical protein